MNMFRVRRDPEDPGSDLWEVSLPHECDRWTVAGDVNYGEYVSHPAAVGLLEEHIAQAQVALASLRSRSELNPNDR